MRIHSITENLLQVRGVSLKEILDSGFLQSLNTSDYILSHNINFDFNILLNELFRMDYDIPEEWALKLICSCEMTEFTKLQKLYDTVVKNQTGQDMEFHDASNDVLAVFRVITQLTSDKL